MATKKPLIKSYVKQEIYNKIKVLAEKENRSVSNLTEFIIEKAITDYESQHGNITNGDITINGDIKNNVNSNISIGSNNK